MITWRPGTRSIYLPSPAFGVEVRQPLGGAVPRWLTGGIPASNCMAAYEPKGAASLAASYLNLNSPGTNDAAPGVAPAFDPAIGWTFDGATQFLTTGLTPASTWTILVQYSGVTNAGRLFGVECAGFVRWFIMPNSASKVFYYNNSNIGIAPALTAGNVGMAGTQPYRNGVAEGAPLTGGAFDRPLYIGASNSFIAGGAYSFLAGSIAALYIYNADLAAYVPGLVAAMATI
jgi:hypothetical protein